MLIRLVQILCSCFTKTLIIRSFECLYILELVPFMVESLFMSSLLRNILKGLSASVTVYIDTKHCGLKQCNGSPALDTKSCNGSGGGMGLSFCWGAFGIKGMVREKIVSTTFGGAAGHGERAPGTGAAHARIVGASVGRPLRGADREPYGAWAALTLRGADPSATWRLGGLSTRGRPQRHLALESWQKA